MQIIKTIYVITFFVTYAGLVTGDLKPNILYILADDLGFGDVSWNNPSIYTPQLESMAKQGIILDHFYTQPKCSPSRAALLTGLYPYKTSMQRGSIGPFRPSGLPTHIPTLPQLLQQQGYSTHLVGKWHLGYCSVDYTPTRRGFDTFFGEYSQQSDHYTRIHEVNPHIGSGYDLWRGENISYDGAGMYSTNLWEKETINLIENVNRSNPWFIELSLTAVHPPYQVPDKFIERYLERRKNHQNRRKNKRGKKNDSDYELDVVRKGMITAIDDSVGKIMEALKKSGMFEDTLIIFTSDNGSGYSTANGRLKGKKGYVFEGGVRVPAFVYGPYLTQRMTAKPGYTSKALVHIVDWFPTLLGLAGRKVQTETDGLDIWKSLLEGRKGNRDVMVYNIDVDDQSETFQLALRKGDWKLIWGQTREFKPSKRQEDGNQVHLYNITEDPYERFNRADEEPEVVQELKDLARSLAKDSKAAFFPLRQSLGYPRYHGGTVQTGWCEADWWKILWSTEDDTAKARLLLLESK